MILNRKKSIFSYIEDQKSEYLCFIYNLYNRVLNSMKEISCGIRLLSFILQSIIIIIVSTLREMLSIVGRLLWRINITVSEANRKQYVLTHRNTYRLHFIILLYLINTINTLLFFRPLRFFLRILSYIIFIYVNVNPHIFFKILFYICKSLLSLPLFLENDVRNQNYAETLLET